MYIKTVSLLELRKLYPKTVSLLDFSEEKALVESLRDTGFVILRDHCISPIVLNKAYEEWAAFFSLPLNEKQEFSVKEGSQQGYFKLKSENAKDSPIKDLKEFYHSFHPFKDMPSYVQNDFDYTHILAVDLERIASNVLTILDRSLPDHALANLSKSLTDSTAQSSNILLRAIHYPPLGGEDENEAVRAAAHEDINLITILPAATQMGLEVKDLQGNWHKVECDPGSVIVNVGDMLQEATGGYLRSTTHRVVNPVGLNTNTSRYSLPLFVHAADDFRLSKRYTAKQFLDERLKEIGLKK